MVNIERIKKTVVCFLTFVLTVGILACCGAKTTSDELIDEISDQLDSQLESILNGSKTGEQYNRDATLSINEIDVDSIDYLELNCVDLFKEIDDNPLKKEKYLNQYVAISGYCGELFQASNGERRSFTVEPSRVTTLVGDKLYFRLADESLCKRYISCNVLSQEQAKILDTYKAGSEITVCGKIIKFGSDTNAVYIDLLKVEPNPDKKDFNDIEFAEVTVDALNAPEYDMGVEEAISFYDWKYIKLSGRIGSIYETCVYIKPENGFGGITIDYANEEQVGVMMEKSEGDPINIWGHIDHINIYVDGVSLSMRLNINALKIE